jgi:hypothetical protein
LASALPNNEINPTTLRVAGYLKHVRRTHTEQIGGPVGIFDRIFGAKPSQTATPVADMTSEQYLFSMVDSIQAKERTTGYESLTPAEQVFFCVWELEAEINNGGFEQFYLNSSGDIAAYVPDALRAIGATHTASLVDQANAVVGSDGPPTDRDARTKLVEALDDSALDRFEQLDAAFLEYKDNLSALLAEYMKANA